MADIKFTDNSIKVIRAIDNAVYAFLEEAAGELETQVARNTRVDTGQLKSSWRHEIDESKCEAVVGSPLENAIWEEFGTGEHALKGDGRKGGWFYVDRKGKGHFTRGKSPSRAFHNAKVTCEPKIKRAAENRFRGLDK